MTDLLLTHGYFLAEDEKERQIMKPYPPLGLLYLSAYLKQRGFGVEVYDSTFGTPAELYALFERAPGGTVGLYTNLITRRAVLAAARRARACGWTVIMGGPESANYAREYLDAGADVIVVGEGEATTAALLPALAAHGVNRLHAVDGVVFRDEAGAVVRTAPRAQLPDLDALPEPDRAAIDHRRYLEAWRTHHGAGSINRIPARGCPYRCNWCSHAVYGYSHRRRSPAGVADEVAGIVERYDPEQLWYADDVFTISHPWLEAYRNELKARGIHRPFETITRADRLLTDQSAATLRELGCYRVWLGSESGSQRILDAMQRGVTVEEVQRAAALARKHGIAVGMFLMWGYEGEELEDIDATVEHVKATDPDVFFTTVSYPIKGTPYFDRVADRVGLELPWEAASDRDYVIRGRRGRDYYRLADTWLRGSVEGQRLRVSDPERAARADAAGRAARAELGRLHGAL